MRDLACSRKLLRDRPCCSWTEDAAIRRVALGEMTHTVLRGYRDLYATAFQYIQRENRAGLEVP
jgi:hypothetical protein